MPGLPDWADPVNFRDPRPPPDDPLPACPDCGGELLALVEGGRLVYLCLECLPEPDYGDGDGGD